MTIIQSDPNAIIIEGDLSIRDYSGPITHSSINSDVPLYFHTDIHFDKDVHVESSLKIGDMDVKKIIEHQANEINHLKRKLEELYYAPGMPGYMQSQESFDSNKKRKI